MARDPILVAESFGGRPCHTCGATEDIVFLRFRTRAKAPTEAHVPSEMYLRLCKSCVEDLKSKL